MSGRLYPSIQPGEAPRVVVTESALQNPYDLRRLWGLERKRGSWNSWKRLKWG
jgi:hypothetical protein